MTAVWGGGMLTAGALLGDGAGATGTGATGATGAFVGAGVGRSQDG